MKIIFPFIIFCLCFNFQTLSQEFDCASFFEEGNRMLEKDEYQKAFDNFMAARISRDCEQSGIDSSAIEAKLIEVFEKAEGARKENELNVKKLKANEAKLKAALAKAKEQEDRANATKDSIRQVRDTVKQNALLFENQAKVNWLTAEALQEAPNDPTLALQIVQAACDSSKNDNPLPQKVRHDLLSDEQNLFYTKTFKRAEAAIKKLAFSESGNILSIDESGMLTTWSISGEVVDNQQLVKKDVYDFSSDVSFVLAASGQRASCWRHNPKLEEIGENGFNSENGFIRAVSPFPDKDFFLIGTGENKVSLWSAKGGVNVKNGVMYTYSSKRSRNQPALKDVTAVCASPSSLYVVGADSKGVGYIWAMNEVDEGSSKPHNSTPLVDFKHDQKITALDYYSTPKEDFLVSGSEDGIIKVFKITTNNNKFLLELSSNLISHDAEISSLSFSQDGKYILSTSHDKTTKLWSVQEGKLIYNLKGHKSEVLSASFSEGGKYIVTGSKDGEIKLWINPVNKMFFESGTSEPIRGLTFSEDGTNLLFCQKNYLKVFTLQDKSIVPKSTIRSRVEISAGTAFSKGDFQILLGVSHKRKGVLFYKTAMESTDLDKVEPEKYHFRRVRLSNETINDVIIRFSENSRFIVLGAEKIVQVWDAYAKEPDNDIPIFTLNKQVDGDITGIAVSDDGNNIIVSSSDKKLYWIDRKIGNAPKLQLTTDYETSSIRISNQGDFLIGDVRGNLMIWDTKQDNELVSFPGKPLWGKPFSDNHKDAILEIKISDNNRFVISVSTDNTVKVWALKSKQCLQTIRFDKAISSIALSSNDPGLIIVGFKDGELQLCRNLVVDIEANLLQK